MDNIRDISEYIKLCKGALDLLKGVLTMLPKGAAKDEIERKVQAAEDALQRSDVKLAKDLGMRLCDCSFPPQIMLWSEQEKAHICQNPECGRTVRPKKQSRPIIRSTYVGR